MSSALYCRSRYIMYTNYRRLNVVTAFIKMNNNNTDLAKCNRKFALNSILPCRTLSMRRYFSTDQNENPRPYIPLMDFPRKPNVPFFEMGKCHLAYKYGIPKIDPEFDFEEFTKGSLQAVLTVSNALSREDYESLEDLVAPDAIEILKGNISRMSDEQKAEIAMDSKELVLFLPANINIRNDESSKTVEILMLYHFLRNLKNSPKPNENAEITSPMERLQRVFEARLDQDLSQHAFYCNYRFVRNYGHTNSSWLIDLVNHFRLCDVMK
ncbi:m-AAA protease-interacting protein 1, mitochondrial-like [Diprion similis]|uniref:m-AAA protease-interacting protein 1, mitochondrial-like n=1 Tax=Diprion similis TaxID=362088 RepID=UPI001EF953C6|nr:m-AAA protease-interacting protein 1, mitochondrial-like [Diprion similis]